MGGSGGEYFPTSNGNLEQKIKEAQEKEKSKLISDINDLLSNLLLRYNNRDVDRINEYLEKIEATLGEEFNVEKILFGGSVAKHTAVDGLSDVDALVILNKKSILSDDPKDLLNYFYSVLNLKLKDSDEKKEITKGNLAVTIIFKDNTEIQLLPAVQKKNKIFISTQDGTKWNETNPAVFKKLLTTANQKTNNSLIPAIKLFKSINASLSQEKQLKGYHIEAIAIDAISNYKGEKSPRTILLHIIDYASNRVLKPIKDITGQSKQVDSYLGPERSDLRNNISKSLSIIKKVLESSSSINQWKAVFGFEDGK